MKKKTLLVLLASLALGPVALAGADLTAAFFGHYESEEELTPEEVKFLKDRKKVVLIPGILAEAFIHEGGWSLFAPRLDFTFMTKNYFQDQIELLEDYGVPVARLPTSSSDVRETYKNIDGALKKLLKDRQQAVFMAHSMGGLVLLDYLIDRYDEVAPAIAGIVFLQSPFHGAPLATLYNDNPPLQAWFRPFFPMFRTSDESVKYLGFGRRGKIMADNQDKIKKIVAGVPMLTVGSWVNGYRSLFQPVVDLFLHGCFMTPWGSCWTREVYPGPYEVNDGMVPFSSSQLPGADFVELEAADHGETVLRVAFSDYNRQLMTQALMKLLLKKAMR